MVSDALHEVLPDEVSVQLMAGEASQVMLYGDFLDDHGAPDGPTKIHRLGQEAVKLAYYKKRNNALKEQVRELKTEIRQLKGEVERSDSIKATTSGFLYVTTASETRPPTWTGFIS